MDVSELRSLIRDEQMPLTDVEAIFRALVRYPDGENIHNATRADLTEALEHACRSLVGDMAPMPPEAVEAILGAGGVAAGDGSYDWGAAAVSDRSDVFTLRLRQ